MEYLRALVTPNEARSNADLSVSLAGRDPSTEDLDLEMEGSKEIEA
jgi:hypothetical protein